MVEFTDRTEAAQMEAVDASVLAQIDDLQTHYIAALDSRNMQGWLATFSTSPSASYIHNTAESVENDLPIALVMDDNHLRLEDRVTYVTKIWAGTYAEYFTRHIVQRTSCTASGAGQFDVLSNFIVAYTPTETGRSELLAAGIYEDRVVIDNDGAHFLSKKVITDSSFVERFLAYPL